MSTTELVAAILSILDSDLDPRLKCDTIRAFLDNVEVAS